MEGTFVQQPGCDDALIHDSHMSPASSQSLPNMVCGGPPQPTVFATTSQEPELLGNSKEAVIEAVSGETAPQTYDYNVAPSSRTSCDSRSSHSDFLLYHDSKAVTRHSFAINTASHYGDHEGQLLVPVLSRKPSSLRSETTLLPGPGVTNKCDLLSESDISLASGSVGFDLGEGNCDDRKKPARHVLHRPPLQEPKLSFKRLSNLDNFLIYREELSDWKRISSAAVDQDSEITMCAVGAAAGDFVARPEAADSYQMADVQLEKSFDHSDATQTPFLPALPTAGDSTSTFRNSIIEVGFCFTIAMTQFLAEYLISGFAIILPKLIAHDADDSVSSISAFWPAALLSLILSACLLIFARLSDMHGGYPYFMFGVCWLALWTLLPGFSKNLILLDVSRAMQGMAIAAFTPSAFTMVGSIYPEGPRRNFVLGVYGAMAPLGFFAGFLSGGVLTANDSQWYTWIASILSFATAVVAYLTVPADRINRKTLGLKMDWLGAFLLTAGFVLVAFALAVEPYANSSALQRDSFSMPIVLGPFLFGLICLAAAVWVEGWIAECPLVPFRFFQPKSVLPFCFACLCFYGCFGTWLYNSTEYFQSPSSSGHDDSIDGLQLALWYTPTAVGGIFFCIAGGSIIHLVPIQVLLMISGLAWICAPLILVLCPTPLDYWSCVMPSTLCATLGIDLTYTISTIFLSSVQPLQYQGLAGAVCSILVNLNIPFALTISEIIGNRARNDYINEHTGAFDTIRGQDRIDNAYYHATFIYAAASAGLGFVVCVLFVRIARSVVSETVSEEKQARA